MRSFVKPRVVVSRCLGFAACRYDGAMIADAFVARLKDHVTFCPVCPEMEIGLGCPRDPIRVVLSGGKRSLVQPSTGRDVTEPMAAFAARFLGDMGEVDGFILKSRSPSCGIKDVKVYGGPERDMPQETGRGFFGAAVLDRFPDAAVGEEGRMLNFTLREHFLTRLFTLATFREILRSGRPRDLVEFHAANKGLLMGYHQTEMRAMGRLVAGLGKRPDADIFAEYGPRLAHALARPPRFTSIINVLQHAMGYVSEGLAAPEKAYFLECLEKYRAGQLPLSVPTSMVKAWAIRFNAANLLSQTYLEPYPEALVAISDSGKGRGG